MYAKQTQTQVIRAVTLLFHSLHLQRLLLKRGLREVKRSGEKLASEEENPLEEAFLFQRGMFFLPHCLTKAGGMSNLGYSAQTPCKGGTHRTNLGTSHMHLLDKHRKQSTLQTPPLFCRQHVPSPKTYRLIWQFELKDSILGTTEFHKAVFTLMVCEGKRKARWIDKKRFGYL